jgi:hypothetical protein
VQGFFVENRDKLGPLADSEGKKLLDASVAKMEAFGIGQSTSALGIDGQLNLQKSLEIDLRKVELRARRVYLRFEGALTAIGQACLRLRLA